MKFDRALRAVAMALLVINLGVLIYILVRPNKVEVIHGPTVHLGTNSHNSFFHVPAEGCHAGSSRITGFFIEDHGPALDACFNPHGDGSIDILIPGEGFVETLRLPTSKQPPKS